MGKLTPHWLLITICLLVGCASPQAQPIFLSPAPIPMGDAAAQATQGARAAQDAQATYQVQIAWATGTAAAATGTVVVATQQAQAVETGTAVAVTATAESLSVQATQMALNATATGNAQAASLGATATVWAMNGTATADAQRILNVEMARQAEATRLAYEAEIQRVTLERKLAWNALWPWLLGGLFILVATGGVMVALFMWRNRRPYYTLDEEKAGRTFVSDGQGGWKILPRPTPLQLPAPRTDDEQTAVVPVPRWEAFMDWRDLLRLPIGVNIQSHKPILVDRISKPHLFIAGTTGQGKTSSGLIPFALSMFGAGVHVVIVNGKGADFIEFEGWENVTVLPPVSDAQAPRFIHQITSLLVQEKERRDQVLYRYRAQNWYELPDSAGQPGEILLAIDEFLTVIQYTQGLIMTSRDREEKQALQLMIDQMWHNLFVLTGQGRKYGLFCAITLTDPTAEAIGRQGMIVRRQMARVLFPMEEASSSAKLLDYPQDYPRGSAGLPRGQFLARVSGQVEHGVAFHPSAENIKSYLQYHVTRSNPLPSVILEGVQQLPSGTWTTGSLPARSSGPSQDEIDGRALDSQIDQFGSLNAVGRYLDPSHPERPSGQFLDTRVKPALQWRYRAMSCERSAVLLSRAS